MLPCILENKSQEMYFTKIKRNFLSLNKSYDSPNLKQTDFCFVEHLPVIGRVKPHVVVLQRWLQIQRDAPPWASLVAGVPSLGCKYNLVSGQMVSERSLRGIFGQLCDVLFDCQKYACLFTSRRNTCTFRQVVLKFSLLGFLFFLCLVFIITADVNNLCFSSPVSLFLKPNTVSMKHARS